MLVRCDDGRRRSERRGCAAGGCAAPVLAGRSLRAPRQRAQPRLGRIGAGHPRPDARGAQRTVQTAAVWIVVLEVGETVAGVRMLVVMVGGGDAVRFERVVQMG